MTEEDRLDFERECCPALEFSYPSPRHVVSDSFTCLPGAESVRSSENDNKYLDLCVVGPRF